ncbi:MAG: hypothetical protein KDD91_00265 [Caldilinea sp.]|nr:hypothetical protein [Caldilinea sp.]MCB0038029.1 hypothetical protein [Caldilinea sp.]MCB0057821.1 hypothetical protein [Caldilineaceae bacterium]MCB0134898.1 hypothetical protein [Caldilineaceae bacterium]HRW46808.1 hypothetical protein [Caldilinea sp.]
MSEPIESSNSARSTGQAARQSGVVRLINALNAAPADRRTCNRIRAAFPAMAEAELRGERMVQLFPTETAHLDACEACALEYGELVDALLELEAATGASPDAPVPTVPAHMLTALRIRRWVTTTAQQVLQKTLHSYGDVEAQLASWLEDLTAASSGAIQPPQPQMALAYGGANTEMALIQVTWFAAQALAEQYTVDELRAMQARSALAVPVRQAAEQVAKHLPKRQRTAFIDTFVAQALTDPSAVIELGRAQ